MKRLSVVLLTVSALLAASCSNNSGPKEKKDTYHFSMNSSMTGTSIEIEADIQYSLKDFDADSTKFNKSIALLSFVGAEKASNKTKLAAFYSAIGFKSIVYSDDYDLPEDKESIKFTLAHYEASDYHLISVVTNGIGYEKPWENNFNLGLEGDAEGFVVASNKVLAGIRSYIESYTDKTIKLWITGYSRSGGISNIVSTHLIDDNTVLENNLFAYTFEAPQVVSSTNTKQYKSVFNIINSADLITHMAPSKYNLKRVGSDVDIYKSNMDKILKKLDNRLRLTSFTKTEYYNNESEMAEYAFGVFTKSFTSETAHDISTRENYVNYFQPNITYLIGLFTSLKSSTTNQIMNRISGMSVLEIAGLISEDGLYNLLKPILDNNHESYNDSELRSKTNALIYFIQANYELISLASNGIFRSNFQRSTECHYPEVVFALLLNY